MRAMTWALILLPPVLVAIYTFNYGRWAWKQKYRFGAVGVFFLSVLTVVVPTLVLIYNE